MKIPEDKFFSERAQHAWEDAAAQIGVELGIMVEVGTDTIVERITYPHPQGGSPLQLDCTRTTRVFFKLNGHEFETLTDLKRALQLKAFL